MGGKEPRYVIQWFGTNILHGDRVEDAGMSAHLTSLPTILSHQGTEDCTATPTEKDLYQSVIFILEWRDSIKDTEGDSNWTAWRFDRGIPVVEPHGEWLI